MKILFRSGRLVLIDALFAMFSIYAALFIRLEGEIASPYFGHVGDHFWQLQQLRTLAGGETDPVPDLGWFTVYGGRGWHVFRIKKA